MQTYVSREKKTKRCQNPMTQQQTYHRVFAKQQQVPESNTTKTMTTKKYCHFEFAN